MVGLQAAVPQGSAAAPSEEKKKSKDKISQYDIALSVDQRKCLPPSILGKALQPRELMRRLHRSIMPCLACVPGTALLVLPIDHSGSVAERRSSPCYTPAQRESAVRDGRYLETISPRQPNQMVVTVCNISTVEDNIFQLLRNSVAHLGSSRLVVFASGDTNRPVSLPQE